MRIDASRANRRFNMAHRCGAKRTEGGWLSRSMSHGQNVVPAAWGLFSADPLPDGSTDTRGGRRSTALPQPNPAAVSTARLAGAGVNRCSRSTATGLRTLCGDRAKRATLSRETET